MLSRADSSGLLSVDKAEVVIELVEMVNVTMPAAANQTIPKTKAELKAEAKQAKQVCLCPALPLRQLQAVSILRKPRGTCELEIERLLCWTHTDKVDHSVGSHESALQSGTRTLLSLCLRR